MTQADLPGPRVVVNFTRFRGTLWLGNVNYRHLVDGLFLVLPLATTHPECLLFSFSSINAV